MKILIVDDHILFREGLVALLDSESDLAVVGSADTVAGTIDKVGALQPDLVLMDFGLPDGTGPDATQAILKQHPHTKIVFLTMHEDDGSLFKAIEHGAKGYLLKNAPVSKLLAYVRGTVPGKTALHPSLTNAL